MGKPHSLKNDLDGRIGLTSETTPHSKQPDLVIAIRARANYSSSKTYLETKVLEDHWKAEWRAKDKPARDAFLRMIEEQKKLRALEGLPFFFRKR